MKLGSLLLITPLLFCASAFASSVCPAVGADTNGCELLVTVTAVDATGAATSFTVTTSSPDQGTYDGSDDTLVGVVNSSGATLNTLGLTSTTDIFNFDGDGACTFITCNGATDPSGYGPAGITFTGINATATAGTVVFNPGIAASGSSWFSLEDAVLASQITSAAPEPSSVLLIGLALPTAFAAYRRRSAAK
jgi:hypothetical protein